MKKEFHCPKCKSNDIQCMVTNETNVTSTGGGYGAGKGCLGYLLFGPLGLLCGACGSKREVKTENKQSTIWACKSCGEKFRDIEEIEAQISKEASRNPVASLIVGIFAFLFIWFMLNITDMPFAFLFSLIFSALMTIPPYFVSKKKKEESLSNLYYERDYITKNAYSDKEDV